MKLSVIKAAIVWGAAVLAGVAPAFADGPERPVQFWGNASNYVERQAAATLTMADRLLAADAAAGGLYPSDTISTNRRAALLLLDQLIHDTRLDGSQIMADFMSARLARALDDMAAPVEGLKAYKLYNCGTVVRTPGATVAWDICRGPKVKESDQRLMADSLVSRIVDQCDVMFLTHNHGDHVDRGVVEMFLAAGKPVVAPTEVLKDDARVMHVRREERFDTTLTLPSGVVLPAVFLPGHQDHLQNNIVVVTSPEGYRFTATGDQWLKEDNDWLIDGAEPLPEVDLLMPICWASRLPELVERFNPKAVMTIHENEIAHSIDHREAYWLSADKLREVRRPAALLTWGEWLQLPPR